MSFQLVPKSVTLNDLERHNGRYMRYFTEFGKPAFQDHNRFLAQERKFMFAGPFLKVCICCI